ncbi:MAG: S-layer homology domain-containing protein, partial [Candidatus Ornithomonoglobus sp.]
VSKASYFCYKVNGIEVMDGGANIRSAAERGGTSYRIAVTRLDEIAAAEYDAPDNFISAGEALKQEDFRLRYVMTEDGARAAYLTDDFRINALTGKRVDCRSEEIKDENGKYAYSDIENHWVKQAAEQLALAGIGFEGGMLLPDETVTAEEMYELLDKQYYNYEKTFKNVKEPLTRNQTAQIITECMGLTELSKSDIFKAPYADATENCGAVAILKGYGIIAGDTDTFRPNDKITRAEFLQILYNTLISKH